MAEPTPTTVRLQNIAQSYGQSAALRITGTKAD
jgi:hypothetical protein